MTKTRKIAGAAAVLLLAAAAAAQPAGAENPQAGSMGGIGTGTYSPGLELMPSPNIGANVDLQATFGGLNYSTSPSLGGLHCNLSGTTAGTSLIEQGHMSGTCFSDLLVIGYLSNDCNLVYTRVGIQMVVSLTCKFGTDPDNDFDAAGEGVFTWLPTSGPSVGSFVIIGGGGGAA